MKILNWNTEKSMALKASQGVCFEDEWVSAANFSKRKKDLIAYARNTLRKDKRLNIRISERDLLELQRKAVNEGLPYQTYVSSIIRKFLNGSLVEAGK